jgi:hypothetical protein
MQHALILAPKQGPADCSNVGLTQQQLRQHHASTAVQCQLSRHSMGHGVLVSLGVALTRAGLCQLSAASKLVRP